MDDARSMVEEFVGDIREETWRREKRLFLIILEHLLITRKAMFSLNLTESANYHLDSYGLESFQCLPLEGYDVRKRVMQAS